MCKIISIDDQNDNDDRDDDNNNRIRKKNYLRLNNVRSNVL